MSDRTDWLERRRRGLGASDIAGVMGRSPWASPWSVFAEKVGLVPLDDDEDESDAKKFGRDLEPLIASWFHRKTGLYVHGEQTMVHRRCNCPCDCESMIPHERWGCPKATHDAPHYAMCSSYRFATVDGFVLDEGTDDLSMALAVFEAKYTSAAPYDEIPEHYRLQVQWQMHCTDLPVAYLAVMHFPFGRPKFEVYDIPRDDALIAEMTKAADEFWQLCLDGTPPPADAHPATAEAIARAYPEHQPGKTVELDDLVDLLTERDDLKEAVAEGEKRVKEIDAVIKAAMGDAEIGTVLGGEFFTYRTTERKGYTVAPTTVRTLRKVRKRDKEIAA